MKIESFENCGQRKSLVGETEKSFRKYLFTCFTNNAWGLSVTDYTFQVWPQHYLIVF